MQEFWRPQPKEPWKDWRMHSMLVPILVSACGFFVTGIFAFAFSDIAVIPRATQSWMVILGSAMIIFGAELNTPFTTIEVFRKILRHESNAWDISALIASLVGTMVNLLVTFASRLSLNPMWKDAVLNWGPLLAGFAVACDYYGSMVELGFLFGSFEMRTESWLEEKRLYLEAQRETEAQDPANWRKAEMADWKRISKGMNGDRPTTLKGVEKALAKERLLPPTKVTVHRWLKMGKGR